MFEIEFKLKFKLNGREVQWDAFVDALKLHVTDAVISAIQQQGSADRARQSSLLQSSQGERRAFGLDDAAKLLSVSKFTLMRRIREGKIRAVRVGRRVLLSSDTIQQILQESS
jgi:excisionase family DNA binding protein